MLKFSNECEATEVQLRSRHQKLFRSFNKCFSIWKQNGVLAQNLLFLSAGILSDAYFSSSILGFSAGIQLSCPTDNGKRAGLIF